MKKILVVDDDESILDAMAMVLEDTGYKVKTILKSKEIFGGIDTFKPNIILLDVLMSGTDGREICKKIKQDEKKKHIPVIMISAHPNALNSYAKYGADGFLPKPFDTYKLLELVEKYTERK